MLDTIQQLIKHDPSWVRYQRLITMAATRQTPPAQIERHHVVPRSHGGSDDASNLVSLSPREHYLAHWLLWRALGSYQMAVAFKMMRDVRGIRHRSKDYEEAKRVYVDNHPLKDPSNRQAQRERMLGNQFDQSVLDKISKSLSGRPPWRNSRVRPGSTPHKQWLDAGTYLEKWIELGRPSVRAFSNGLGEEHNMTLENMIKRFRAGWVPQEDEEWLAWKSEFEQ